MPPSSTAAPSMWGDSDDLFCVSQGHFSTCAFNVIPCPNRCSVKLTRRDLPDHLQHDCPKRKVKCEFCGSEFTGEAYEVSTSHLFFKKSFLLWFLSHCKQLHVTAHDFHGYMKGVFVESSRRKSECTCQSPRRV